MSSSAKTPPRRDRMMFLDYGVSECQGGRETMEDTTTLVPNLSDSFKMRNGINLSPNGVAREKGDDPPPDSGIKRSPNQEGRIMDGRKRPSFPPNSRRRSTSHMLTSNEAPPQAFFAVYDGHGGQMASNYLKENFHAIVGDQLTLANQTPQNSLLAAHSEADQHLKELFVKQDILKSLCGSTCVSVLLTQTIDGQEKRSTNLYCSNMGDSRCVLCADGVAVDLSNDHKASSTQEKARVEEAGGRVINKRIMGNIAVSRAFGDFVMKLPEAPAYWGEEITADLVSPVPEILERGLSETDHFFVMACDGLWDSISSQEAITFVGDLLRTGLTVQEAADRLAQEAIKSGARDNVSIVIVRLDPVYVSQEEGDLLLNATSVDVSSDIRASIVWRHRKKKGLIGNTRTGSGPFSRRKTKAKRDPERKSSTSAGNLFGSGSADYTRKRASKSMINVPGSSHSVQQSDLEPRRESKLTKGKTFPEASPNFGGDEEHSKVCSLM